MRERRQRRLAPVQRGRNYDPKRLFNLDDEASGIAAELISAPDKADLGLWENEKVYFEENRKVAFASAVEAVTEKLPDGERSFAPLILQILAALGGITELRTLLKMFLMYAGHTADGSDFLDGLTRLKSFSIVSGGFVARGPGSDPRLPAKRVSFVFITFFGARAIAKSGAFLPTIDTSEDRLTAEQVKTALSATETVEELLEQGLLSHFVFGRKMPVRQGERLLRVEPFYILNISGRRILYFCVKKKEGWEASMIERLRLCSRLHAGHPPVVMVQTEDEMMTAQLRASVASDRRVSAYLIATN